MHTESIHLLAHRIREARHSEPNRFIFFLGAGASESSGIPTASWMIRDFERKLREVWDSEGRPGSDFMAWVSSKPGWKSNDSPYGSFFEVYEPTQNGRVRYLNKWMASASPGWGYFCLAQLLAQSYVSTIVTANFDDLIYESCTQNSVRRPRVYSTLSPYASVEHDDDRPTIIKLHGDYLYADIKNTSDEMQQLDRRLLADVSRVFQGHDIIVVGYGGTDKLIMEELFATILPADAVFWCTHKNDPVPKRVNEIVSDGHHDNWFKVRIEGFDDFMDEVVNQLDFSLPGIIQPIQAQIDAIPGRIEGSNSRHMRKYLGEAIEQIRREEGDLAQAYGVEAIPETPYRLRLEAMSARLNRQYDAANDLYDRLTRLAHQDTCEVLIEHAVTLELMDRYSQAVLMLPKIETIISKPENLGNYGWLLANLGKYVDGIKYFKQAIDKAPGLKEWQAALAMILSEDGQIDEALKYARELTVMHPDDGPMWAALGTIESLAGNYTTTALDCGNKAVGLSPNGFVENLSLAFALSGSGDHGGAIAALNQIVGDEDEIRYRCLGHFQILMGDFESAAESLQKAVDLTKPARRPKILALNGVALLAKENLEEARRIFESANPARHPGRSYKADDEFAFALCELGAGQQESATSMIKDLATKYRRMKGLLSEWSALLGVMDNCGTAGCMQCISLIESALSAGDQ